MAGLLLSTTLQRGRSRPNKRMTISLSKKALFGSNSTEEWHRQVDFTAGILRPSDQRFPWSFIGKHTDEYLKRKGKLSQSEVDVRLGILIESHEARDVAIAACAHAMSPAAVRALLNVELNVAPATYYGLQTYLESLVAANHCNPQYVTNLEAQWASRLLPYATYGSNAAGRYLEGLCDMLRTSDIPNMNALPDFTILAEKAFKSFGSQLEGFKLKCQWIRARHAIAWMLTLARDSETDVTPPRLLLPEHLMDAQFPIWRIWSSWRPDQARIQLLHGLDSAKCAVLPDMLALEGPDFITGKYATLRHGLIAQYGAKKPLVRFRSLVIEVASCEKAELEDILNRVASIMDVSVVRGGLVFNFFVQLTIARPITQDGLQLLEAMKNIHDTPKYHVHSAILEIWTVQPNIGGQHITTLSSVICALDDAHGEDLRKVLLRPWFVKGIEKCLQECQSAVRSHIKTGLKWTHLAQELYGFCSIVKGSVNCLPLLSDAHRQQLDVLPSADSLKTVLNIYNAAGGEKVDGTLLEANALKDAIESFCVDRLIEKGTLSHASEQTVNAIEKVWNETRSSERLHLAILISKKAGTDHVLLCRCLGQITQLPNGLVREITILLESSKSDKKESCIKFTGLLTRTKDVEIVLCWKGMLYKMLEWESSTILGYSLEWFKAGEWVLFMLDLAKVFEDVIVGGKSASPPILHSQLHLWVQQLSDKIPTIIRLEECLGKNAPAVKCILQGGDDGLTEFLLQTLDALEKAYEQPVERLMQTVTGRLARDGKNAWDIFRCVRALLSTTEEGAEACQRILESVRDNSIPLVVTEVVVAGWLQEEEAADIERESLTAADKVAIRALAFVFDIQPYQHGLPDEKLIEAEKYYKAQEAKIIAEVERLESIQKALKIRDPKGTAIFLQQLGIPDASPLDEEIASLSAEVVDAIEKRGENQVEISIPLASFTNLQRAATGVGTAKNVLVRLFIDYLGGAPPAFCVHLDDDIITQDLSAEHTPWVCWDGASAPTKMYCSGKLTPLTFQLNRVLHNHFATVDECGIAAIYNIIKKRTQEHAHFCIICGTAHNYHETTPLRRSIPCQLHSCSKIWNDTHLFLRIPELHFDSFAVDMLLTGVYAAAMSGRSELLPGCPIKSTVTVMVILNLLPKLTILKDAVNVSETLKCYHKDAEQLLAWACTYFRGFITSASGICRIPTLPKGTHQFVLANASPELERNFATKVSNPHTKVLFHGTSLDRLPSILSQGLRTLSGTTLQRTGAAHGKGIYMADDPATSFSYSPSAVSWKNSGLNNMRLLLGCEVAGNGNSVSPGIHVIKEEKTVMVRYIFLLPNNAYAPNANHVVTPMKSAMSALRSGAV